MHDKYKKYIKKDKSKIISNILKKRILVLDGAMGTMIQNYKFTEEDFRGDYYKSHKSELIGNNDILSITRPEIISEIHENFLKAGSDIIETNTFNANIISQSDYGLENSTFQINFESTRLACKISEKYNSKSKPRFVAGVLGPTNKTLSISPDINRPAFRSIDYDELVAVYEKSLLGLIYGGSDIILIETIFDTLNAKCAIKAIQNIFLKYSISLPVMISGTITDSSGRILSGQTPSAFWHSIKHINPISVGFNCALGADSLKPYIKELSSIADTYISIHPNAGIPNELGEYEDTPEFMSAELLDLAENKYVNIVGGCCGTTPKHIKEISKSISNINKIRNIPKIKLITHLSGLETLSFNDVTGFVNIGERTNVTGSSKFSKVIKLKKYDEAIEIAREQVNNGAQIIDINVDDALLDGKEVMIEFLNLIASEPSICKVPIMIDSSDWDIIEAGLKCIQGKGIVNSISLKDGEKKFLKKAKLIKSYGAATVIMAFDEKGQADNYSRMVAICSRAYNLLVKKINFNPTDIIFDPNIFPIATGINEHNNFAKDFIKAIKSLKKKFPFALTSGGVSNISFSFRGNLGIRQAMHSVFLYHTNKAGLDMAIINAGQLSIYERIEKNLKEKIENVIFNKNKLATEELLKIAEKKSKISINTKKVDDWRKQNIDKKIEHALVNGIDDFIVRDVEVKRKEGNSPLEIIEGSLMKSMNIVGDLFGSGQMFLPQVVKSARVMKKAVGYLHPFMKKEEENKKIKQPIVIIATVKGDVHDIGKNIVSVVMQCNNIKVIDLGVMVPAQKIIQAIKKHKPDIIGLSGLITPSLNEMVNVATELNKNKIKIPLLIGGATTSRLHTALKIAPQGLGATIHVNDASRSVHILNSLINPIKKEIFIKNINKDYKDIVRKHLKGNKPVLLSLKDARKNRIKIEWKKYKAIKPRLIGTKLIKNICLKEIIKYIDWTPFFQTWELSGRFPKILEDKIVGKAAKELHSDALKMLTTILEDNLLQPKAIIGIYRADSLNEEINIYDIKNKLVNKFIFLRQQLKKSGKLKNLCLSDFIAPEKLKIVDYMGLFAVTVKSNFSKKAKLDIINNDYNSIMFKALSDRLAEALAELIHLKTRKNFWGYNKNEKLDYDDIIREEYVGIRPAPGYPACPDHSHKKEILKILDAKRKIGIDLTENFAMTPLSSVAGFYFGNTGSRYFGVANIGEDQIKNYANKNNISIDQAKNIFSEIIE